MDTFIRKYAEAVELFFVAMYDHDKSRRDKAVNELVRRGDVPERLRANAS
jgi:hypothetical protein